MKPLSCDRKQICIGVLKGHARRTKELQKRCGSAQTLPDQPALRAEIHRMEAVNRALQLVGLDIPNAEIRKRLADNILENCINGRMSPFERLCLDEFSRSDFYRRRTQFLCQLSEFLML